MKSISNELQTFVNTLRDQNPDAALHAKCRGLWKSLAQEYEWEHTDNVVYQQNDNGGQIIIYVDNALIAADLNAKSQIYLMQIKNNAEDLVVDKLIFRISRYKYVRNNEKKEEELVSQIDNVPSVSLSLEEKENWSKKLLEIKDERLRESLYSALIKDIEWKKGIQAAKRA